MRRRLGLFALGIGLLLALWSLGAIVFNAQIILPGPWLVLPAFWQLLISPGFAAILGASALRVLLAISIALPLATLVGVLAGLRPRIYDVLRPGFALIAATPVLSIILIAFFIFGQEGTPVFSAFLIVFPIVSQAAMGAIAQVDEKLQEMARVFRLSRRARFRYLYLPALVPSLLSGLRAALALSWKVVVAAEVLIQPLRSLGRGMYQAKMNLETAELFAWTIATVFFAGLSEAAIPLVQRLTRIAQKIWQVDVYRPSASAPSLFEQGSAPASLEFTAIDFSWPGREVFRDFSLSLAHGERLAVLGPSGSGKTTLLSLAAGLIQPSAGRLLRQGDGATSFVFQDSRLIEQQSILKNVAIPLYEYRPDYIDGKTWQALSRDCAAAMLERVGLGDRLFVRPGELSGGQRQRVALARAFVVPAPLLLLDEPFQSLDLPLRIQLMDLTLDLLKAYPRSLIAITHDVREAIYLCNRAIVLGPSGIVHEESVELSRQERAYSSSVRAAAPAALEARLLSALGA